ncbi:hypothetical protein ABTZ21_31640 [Streptomyces sp. NPDC096191]|uniref:hypothetical protein n=1 Tax=Streptomyces sp. NPDC096191 TaxID=3155426 RepID=UPI003333529F
MLAPFASVIVARLEHGRLLVVAPVQYAVFSTTPLPDARAAAYRLLVDLPGIRVQNPAIDPLGRRGVAITLPDDAQTRWGV